MTKKARISIAESTGDVFFKEMMIFRPSEICQAKIHSKGKKKKKSGLCSTSWSAEKIRKWRWFWLESPKGSFELLSFQ